MPFPTPTSPRSPISATERTVVHVLVHHYRSQGMSASIIKKNLLQIDGWNVTEGGIRNMWNKELEEIVDRRGKGVGRPSRSPETKNIIIENQQYSISTIQRLVKEQRDQTISRSTISNEFKRNGLKSLRYGYVGALKTFHIENRLAFADRFKDEPVEFWERCLFTDEKMWELDSGGVNRQNKRLRAHRASEVPPMDKEQYARRWHVWGGLSVNGLSNLVFLSHSVDGNSYRALLMDNMDNFKQLFPQGNTMIFEDDWTRPHTAEESVKFKEQHFPNFFRTRLREKEHEWYAPSKMDDLWPIERIWRHLVNVVFNDWPLPGSDDEWKERIQSAWDNVSVEL